MISKNKIMLLFRVRLPFSYSLKQKQKLLFFGSWPVGYPTLLALNKKFGN